MILEALPGRKQLNKPNYQDQSSGIGSYQFSEKANPSKATPNEL
jgi:hypothetical protein